MMFCQFSKFGQQVLTFWSTYWSTLLKSIQKTQYTAFCKVQQNEFFENSKARGQYMSYQASILQLMIVCTLFYFYLKYLGHWNTFRSLFQIIFKITIFFVKNSFRIDILTKNIVILKIIWNNDLKVFL